MKTDDPVTSVICPIVRPIVRKNAADTAGAPAVYWLPQDFNMRVRALYDSIGTKTPFIRYNRI